MKSKNTTYYLIGSFILIWGIVGYKLIDTFIEKDEEDTPTYQYSTSTTNNTAALDTFTVHANYRDPFLGKNYYSPTVSTINTTHTTTHTSNNLTSNTAAAPAILQQIQFRGIISNTSQQKDIALLVIEGEEHLLNEGEIVGNILVENIQNTSVIVLIDEKRYTINLEQ